MAPRGRQNSNAVPDRSFLKLSTRQPWREKVVMHYVFPTARGGLEIGQNDSHGLGVVAHHCGPGLGKAKVACIVRVRAAWATE